MLARALEGQDLYSLWERQYRPKDGPPGLPMAAFFDQTAAQLYHSFFRPAWATPPEQDAVAVCRAVNARRAGKGQPPVVPPHLLKGVPRAD